MSGKTNQSMIWSPLAGGEIFTGQSERAVRVRETVQKLLLS